ncbi:MAG TPA: hypothetical protein VNV66_07900, partial [Pilimelia sp.]|nr:hypothetical protein [Pilimelia sp.]
MEDAVTAPNAPATFPAEQPVSLVCGQCREPAQPRPPVDWLPAWGACPGHSHLDGSPLCPVIGPHGYEPCTPEPVARTVSASVPAAQVAPADAGVWLTGDGVHWTGSFVDTVAYLVANVLSDGGPVPVTCYLRRPDTEHIVTRLHGTALAVTRDRAESAVLFADGARARLTDLIAIAL